jgi:NAD(P)-dependent dehydrogenase (short-subunit alcohol dehydrogenase family)
MGSHRHLPLAGRSALVTGASRGIGAETARILAARGVRVAVNYRERARRAEAVVASIRERGGEAVALGADLTDAAALKAMAAAVRQRFGTLHLLVLNASGGMERDAEPGYARRLNRDAQVATVEALLPLMPPGARVVFVTSHQAHFVDRRPTLAAYEPVARSKRAGEDALRERTGELAAGGVDLVVVCGDMVEGTVTATLLERRVPGTVADRRAKAGGLPTVAGFAAEVADAAVADVRSGHTVYVGGPDYLT